MMRSDLAKRFEKSVGKPCEEFFGDFSYVHKKSGRRITENIFPFHSYAFSEGLIHAENLGGDIELVLNQPFSSAPSRGDTKGLKPALVGSSVSQIAARQSRLSAMSQMQFLRVDHSKRKWSVNR